MYAVVGVHEIEAKMDRGKHSTVQAEVESIYP
jgi:putative ribosome biogenesis GTPase RsgA